MTTYLVGARGRLGQALASEYADAGIASLDRSIYEGWVHPHSEDKVSLYFSKLASEGATLLVASGLLDPSLPTDDLMKVNYHLPKNIVDGAAKLGIKVITFGTAMEGLLRSRNPYVQSKAALGEYVESAASAGLPALHLQVHTLYGLGEPSAFMFLGQMLSSMRSNTPFKMTSGRQLREYHHLADDAKAIRLLSEEASPGVMSVSHGQPVRLKDLAESVFEAMGKSHLLQVGALPEPSEENYAKALELVDILQQIEFRDTIPAVVQYMKDCNSSLRGRR